MEKEQQKPILLEQSGRVRGKIWVNRTNDGRETYSIDIYRTYKVNDPSKLKGEHDRGFRNVSSIAYQDIDNARIQLDRADAIIQERIQEMQEQSVH